MPCKYIKLSSGDDIITITDDDCSTFQNKEFIQIKNPVKVGVLSLPRNGMIVETAFFLPWIAVSSLDTMQLSTKNIILVVDVSEKIGEHYKNYISNSTRKEFSEEEVLEEDYDEEELEEDEEYDESTTYH